MVRRVVAVLGLLVTAASALARSFVNFESGQVRPLALSPASDRLFAVNTPDDRLAIYTIGAGGLTLAAEVPVGLEPVAVAARTDLAGRTEAWVMNHLSDSVSVVEIDPADAKVGTFGVPPGTQAPATGFLGDQVRGFGFLHDGSIDSVFDFLHVNVFAFFHEHDHELERGDDYDHELDHDDDAPLSRAEVPHDHDDGTLTGVKLGS